MQYRYIDDSKQPFVHVDIEPYPGLSLQDALDLIRDSGVYPAPHLSWAPNRQFYGNVAELLSEAERQAPSAQAALVIVENSPTNASFLVGSNLGQVQTYDQQLLRNQLRNTATRVQDLNQPGKRLVWVTCHGDANRYLESLKPGTGRFVPVEVKSEPPPDLADFEKVILSPGEGQEWEFATDDKGRWVDFIDGLTEDGVKEIVGRNLHLHALRRIRRALVLTQGRFERRNHALEMMVACALARVNVVLLGPPGTAKSLMVRTFSEALGVKAESRPVKDEERAAEEASSRQKAGRFKRRMFEYLLTRYTTPEEIFGGADINLLLSAGVHGRRTEGMLPRAETAFLDEIFKANSAILNSLLSITNERLFYNLGQAFRVNLAFVVGASNETPDEEELGALFDRFPVRVPCRSVEASVLKAVITKAHQFESAGQLGSAQFKVPRTACLNDLRLLTKVVQGGVYGGTEAFPTTGTGFDDHFISMLLAIRRDYNVSDRTPVQVLRLCRALALLEGESPASQLGPRHLRAWGYVAPKMASATDLQRVVRARIQQADHTAGDLFDEQ